MSIHRVAEMAEIWVHLWVGHHFRTSELDFDHDTAASDTQVPAAGAAVPGAAVQD